MTPPRLRDPVPQLEVAGEFAALVVELHMRRIGRGLGIHRPVAHVLHAERTGDYQHLVQGLAATRFEDHATHARVQRQARQFGADGRQLVRIVDGAQFRQQLVAIRDGARLRSLDEREVLHHAQPQRFHAQDHAGQRTAQDLGVGEAWALREILLLVQPQADPVGDASAAPGPLVGR